MTLTTDYRTQKLQQFTIRAANSSQAEQHARAAWAIWNKGKTWEQFWEIFQMETNEAEWGKEALVCWVLVRLDDPEGDIYAGCKTFRRNGWVKHRGADDIEKGYVYDVTYVVTPKQHLRNGYANRLLSLLHRHLGLEANLPPVPESWGKDQPALPLSPEVASRVPKAIGSYLWSDIGSTFYSRCSIGENRPGWVVEEPSITELVWKIHPSTLSIEEPLEWLYVDDLKAVAEELHVRQQKRLQEANTSERSLFLADPATPGSLGYLTIKGSWSTPTDMSLPAGLRIKSSSDNSSDDAIILFTIHCSIIAPRFLIRFVSNLSPAQLPVALSAFDYIATKAGHTEGCVWGLTEEKELVEAWKAQPGREVTIGRRPELDGHMLGVAWYGKEEDNGGLLDTQMWGWQ
ncbi:hypothetical protein AYX13_02319 [Cryptococcus neoformans]|nr:hypothetical protein AYX13_02319 [Cryptococcus neoformans var. grubii]